MILMNKNSIRLFPDEERFWLQVDKRGPDECWEWKRVHRGARRYAVIHVNGLQMQAHRYSYELHNGPISPGMCIMHTCDNGFCVNPNHLRQGTQKENMQDAERKGRMIHPGGERHNMAKLKENDVAKIKRMILDGVSLAAIARMFKVDICTISDIKSKRHWISVSPEARPQESEANDGNPDIRV
jgi:hypothetical protein